MPDFINTFTYTGTLQQAVIPAGTTSMDVYLWGGAGGGGGSDTYSGAPGAAGHFVSDTGIDLTAHRGSTLTVAVGGGGAGGSSGGGTPGGSNGRSITGYSGGVGGQSGPSGWSGSGGGAGGASVIKIDTNPIIVAGGGGGGGGGGNHSAATAGLNSNTPGSGGSLGENGGPHSTGDGGGGGAGGGGVNGGKGGDGGQGDNGGGGGASGSDLILSGSTSDDGSGQMPGGTGTQITINNQTINLYQSGVAIGGNIASSGGNGLVIVVFHTSPLTKVKVGGVWKNISDIKFKKSGIWKSIQAAYVKVAGAWNVIFSSVITFTPTAAGFGDASGAGFSGTPGSGGEGGGGRVICTWLQNRGMFSAEDLAVDTAFSAKYLSRTTKIGYWVWACPLVEYMTKIEQKNSKSGSLMIKIIRILAQARANEIAHKMGQRARGDLLGKCTRLIGESFCFAVGLLARPFVEKKFSSWLKIYDAK